MFLDTMNEYKATSVGDYPKDILHVIVRGGPLKENGSPDLFPIILESNFAHFTAGTTTTKVLQMNEVDMQCYFLLTERQNKSNQSSMQSGATLAE